MPRFETQFNSIWFKASVSVKNSEKKRRHKEMYAARETSSDLLNLIEHRLYIKSIIASFKILFIRLALCVHSLNTSKIIIFCVTFITACEYAIRVRRQIINERKNCNHFYFYIWTFFTICAIIQSTIFFFFLDFQLVSSINHRV